MCSLLLFFIELLVLFCIIDLISFKQQFRFIIQDGKWIQFVKQLILHIRYNNTNNQLHTFNSKTASSVNELNGTASLLITLQAYKYHYY